jgi:transposase
MLFWVMTRADARTQKRKEVVEAIILRKEPATLVARIYNTPIRNVFRWLARYRNGGWQALNEGSKQGRPKKVTGDDMEWLYEAITMGNPMNYQFSFCLWTLNTIRGLLEQERQVKLSKSSVSRLLNHLGLSPQKPLYKSYKQDPKRMKEYLAQTYPEAVAEAQKYKARLYFIDEAAFRSDAHRGTTWGKIGETPVIKDTGGRFGFKLISAVSARGDMHFDVIEGRMNSERFIDYLKQLRSDTGCPVFVIADNARYHHSKKVQAFLEEKQGEIMMAFLPAYSPELNPDEQVWNHAKAEVGKKSAIRSKDDMERVILSAMKAIQEKTDLVKSFFKLPCTKYAQGYL